MVQKTKMVIIVATAIATLGLGSPAFAATYGGDSTNTGDMLPSYYDKNGWHPGLPPEVLRARAALQRESTRLGRGLYLYAGRSRGLSGYASIAHPVRGANGPAASSAGDISNEVLQNDWFLGETRY